MNWFAIRIHQLETNWFHMFHQRDVYNAIPLYGGSHMIFSHYLSLPAYNQHQEFSVLPEYSSLIVFGSFALKWTLSQPGPLLM
jgi:hypothetical protein